MRWELLCQPIDWGRLGPRPLALQNKAFLLKLGFPIISNTNDLWLQVLLSKYRIHNRVLMSIGKPNSSSFENRLQKFGLNFLLKSSVFSVVFLFICTYIFRIN